MSKTNSLQQIQDNLIVEQATNAGPDAGMIENPDKLQAYQQLQKQAHRLTLLNEMATELNTTTTADGVFKVAAAKTKLITESDRVSVTLLNSCQDTLEVFVLDGIKGAIPVGTIVPVQNTTGEGRAILEKRVIINSDIRASNSSTNDKLVEQGIHSTLVVPLILTGGVTIGTLNIGSRKVDAYGPNDESLMLQVASLVASKIENQRLVEQLQARAAELEAVTNFLDTIIDNVPNGIFVKDAENLNFVRWNKANESLIGLTKEDVLGRNDYDFFPKNEADLFVATDRRILAEGKPLEIPEEEIHTAHRGVRLLRTKKVPLFDANGKPKYLLGVSEDITERKQAEEVEAEHARLNTFTAEVSLALTQNDTLRNTLQQCTEMMVKHLDAAFARIWTFNVAENVLELQASAGLYTHIDGAHGRVPVGKFKIGLIAAEHKPHLTNDILNDPRLGDKEWAQREGMVAFAGYPLIVEDRLVGVMAMFASHPLKEEVLQAMKSIANTVALSVERKQVDEKLTKRAIELETVAEVSVGASTILDTNKLLWEVTNLTRDRFNLYHAHIYLLDETEDTLHLRAGSGEVGQKMVNQGWKIPVQRTASLVAQAARIRQGVIENNVHKNPDFLPNPLLPDTRAEMAVPIIVGDKLLGILDVQAAEVDFFTDEDVRIQTILAAQIAVAIQNAERYERTQTALAEVQESQELLRTIIDATPDWIFVKDRQHRFQLVNRGYANSLQMKPDDLIDKNDLELGFPEDIVKGNPEKGIRGFWPDDTEVMDSGQPKIIDVEPAEIDGQPRFLSTIKVPLRDATGQIWGILGYVRDITQREQLLTEAEDQARRLLLLNELGAELNQAGTVEGILNVVASKTVLIVGGQRASVALLNPAGDKLEIFALDGVKDAIAFGTELPINGTQSGKAVREKRLINTPSIEATNFLESRQLARQGFQSTMTAPLMASGLVLGVLNVGSRQLDAYGPRDESLMLQIASLLSSALENKRLLQQAQIRAQRERTLREVTAHIRSSVDVDTVMRTAAREVGQVLGRPIFVRLNNSQDEKDNG